MMSPCGSRCNFTQMYRRGRRPGWAAHELAFNSARVLISGVVCLTKESCTAPQKHVAVARSLEDQPSPHMLDVSDGAMSLVD